MIIKEKTSQTRFGVTGRLSDGSDRQEVEITTYNIKVEDAGRLYMLTFDHDPTDAEIQAALDVGLGVEVGENLSAKLEETRQVVADLSELLIAAGVI